ncbi:MAG: twin-arginine translocase TatA/TatE family subunit [Planctomycetes bacterium]|nr:twin-arginine translocase TatA/TatE family subunit [Planctomycetota bacterium]
MIAFLGSPVQWAGVILIALLLFGHRLPTMARSLGGSITEFKKGLKDGSDSNRNGGGSSSGGSSSGGSSSGGSSSGGSSSGGKDGGAEGN